MQRYFAFLPIHVNLLAAYVKNQRKYSINFLQFSSPFLQKPHHEGEVRPKSSLSDFWGALQKRMGFFISYYPSYYKK